MQEIGDNTKPRIDPIGNYHSQNDHTENRTFRLPKEAYHLLELESRDRGISENTIVLELIMKDLRARRAHRQLKPIHFPAITVRALLENLPDDKLIEVASNAAEDVLVQNIPIEIGGDLSARSIVEMMKSCNDVAQTQHREKQILIISHYAGRKFSLFAGTMYKGLFSKAGANVEFTFDDAAVVFDLDSLV